MPLLFELSTIIIKYPQLGLKCNPNSSHEKKTLFVVHSGAKTVLAASSFFLDNQPSWIELIYILLFILTHNEGEFMLFKKYWFKCRLTQPTQRSWRSLKILILINLFLYCIELSCRIEQKVYIQVDRKAKKRSSPIFQFAARTNDYKARAY